MKKIIAVVLSLAMILSMTVVGFAAEVPAADADEAAWTAYYTEVLTDETMDVDTKAQTILDNMPVTTNPTGTINALTAAMDAAEAQGIDTNEITLAMMDKMEEETGIDFEEMMGEDLDGDGYIGNDLVKPADPTDVEAWTTYYTILLGEAATNPTAVITVVPEIAGNVTNGEIDMDTFASAFPEAAKAVGGDVVNQIVWGVEELLSTDLNSDGYVGKPTGDLEDGQLPEDDTDSEGGMNIGDILSGAGDFLNTILGVIGDLIGGLLGGGSGDEPTTDPSDDENLWGDDEDLWGDDGGSTIPDTGDTTVFAVAAVALVAGAALVMTRKKDEDAE